MKKILVIGAGFLQSFVIKKAKEMGYFTLAVDADKNAVGFQYADQYEAISIIDEQACLEYAAANKIDGVLTAATDYGVLTSACIAEAMELPGISYQAARLLKNKYQTRKCLFENNVDDTQQAYEITCNTDIEGIKAKIEYPVMVKPCDGSGSRGACKVTGEEQLEKACQAAMNSSLTHRALAEAFIRGREYGVESLVIDGTIYVLGVMKKLMTAPPFYAELGHSMPSGLPSETEKKIRTAVQKAIKALGITSGSVNMDVLVTDSGKVHIIDIGARMGGNMIGPCIIPYGTGIDYMAAMIKNAVGDTADLNVHPHGAVATKLLAFDEGVIKRLPDFEQIQKNYGVEIYHHMKIGQHVNEYHTNLDGCGYIVAMACEAETAEHNAGMALKYITDYIF